MKGTGLVKWIKGISSWETGVTCSRRCPSARFSRPAHLQNCHVVCFIDQVVHEPPVAAMGRFGHIPAKAAAKAVNTALPIDVARSLLSERIQTAITPELCQQLSSMGWAVVDGVFGRQLSSVLRQEVATISDLMHLNCTHVVDSNNARKLLPKNNIMEAELRDQATVAAAPLCASLQADPTLQVMLNLFLPGLRLDSQAIKAQHNAGGCFPIHTDSDVGVDGRKVTVIAYLNPDWRIGDGGELRLYPWPNPPVDIQPLDDRLVLFTSKTMLHRVLPSAAPNRFCFTVWLSESRPSLQHQQLPPPGLASGSKLTPEAAWACLLHPSLRKHAARCALCEEWAASLEQSHPPSQGRDALLANFWKEIGIIGRVVTPLMDIAGKLAVPPHLRHSSWL